jgi:hypothetical protein
MTGEGRFPTTPAKGPRGRPPDAPGADALVTRRAAELLRRA